MHPELDDSLERLRSRGVEVDAVHRAYFDATPVGVLENVDEMRIEENLAEVRELDMLEPWIGIDNLAEILEPEEPAADVGMNLSACCGAGRATQLAEGRRLEPERTRPHYVRPHYVRQPASLLPRTLHHMAMPPRLGSPLGIA
jgi:hypothetical protein